MDHVTAKRIDELINASDVEGFACLLADAAAMSTGGS